MNSRILIAGPSASGKSTLAAAVAAARGWRPLCLDDYFVRGRKAFASTLQGPVRTFERPELYDGRRLAADLAALECGVVVEGFCLFAYPEIMALHGERYFIDVPFEICLARRLSRTPPRLSDRSFQMVGESENARYVLPQRAMPGVRVLDGMRPIAELLSIVGGGQFGG